jgi:nucleotide-binding universal stress UspA family protein
MTHTFKRILVAVDDSPAASAAIDEGIALAADEGAEIVFANVVSIKGERYMPGIDELERVPDHTTTPTLRNAAQRAKARGVPCTLELLVGYTPKQLALLADDLDVDLIMVGSRHLRGIQRAFVGSTSRALISESTRPILIVPYVRVEEAAAVY